MTGKDELTLIRHTLTGIRSEHSGKDVWNDFVVPRFFKQQDFVSKQPARIEGSRGSGKTMLLRYLSYQTQFSISRETIPISAVEHIGLYWKADTQFLRMMEKRGMDEFDWIPIFEHYFTLKLSVEIVSSLYSIAHSRCDAFDVDDLLTVRIKGIQDFGFESDILNNVREELHSKIRKAEMHIQNIKSYGNLDMLPSTFLRFLIDQIRSASTKFNQMSFFVYVDEYENLLNYQQRVINTKIKSSEPPLTFNIAIKLNGMSEQRTLGEEKLENVADYIVINLDKKIFENDYQIFLAEILLKKISDVSPTISKLLFFDPKILNNVDRLSERENSSYNKACKDVVSKILVDRTSNDLANEVFETPVYLGKLNEEIRKALHERNVQGFSVEEFVCSDFKKASIVNSSLLYRKSLDPFLIRDEFKKLKNNVDNKYTNQTDWEKNNFIGCYLRIVSSYKKVSWFYSGFDVYCALSAGNVRHFLELCRNAFSLVQDNEIKDDFSIDRALQSMAARNASEELFKEIQRFTPLGLQLSKLVEGLGTLFHKCQARERQSETEITHFGFKKSSEHLSADDFQLLSEAEKWGVLRVDQSTKEKSELASGMYEYVLNPIYAPKFLISYRKGRKLDLTTAQFRRLYVEGKSAVADILKSSEESDDIQKGLFS